MCDGAVVSTLIRSQLIVWLLRLFRWTWRVHWFGRPLAGPALIALFHEEQLGISLLRRSRLGGRPLAVLVSRSVDGALGALVAQRMGYRLVRGSSSSGAVLATRKILRLLRAGTSVAVTVDGPRGPRRRCDDALVRIAQAAGVPLIPFRIDPRRAWRLRSWDRFCIPRPFTRLMAVFAGPVDRGLEQRLATCPRDAVGVAAAFGGRQT